MNHWCPLRVAAEVLMIIVKKHVYVSVSKISRDAESNSWRHVHIWLSVGVNPIQGGCLKDTKRLFYLDLKLGVVVAEANP